jgi:transcriptional antiterminator RfaH
VGITTVADEHWYVIRSKPKQESRADANLRSWGLETFAPRVRELSSRTGHEATFIIAPFFPGYLFARFDATRLLTKIRLTRGVHSVLGFGEPATPIADAAIALIRSRVRDDGLVQLDGPRHGDTVEVVHGPLRSLVGIFDSAVSGGERVRILLTSVTCHVHIDVPKAFIRKIAAVRPAC